MERESLYVDNLIQAMAARASGGLVLCQVERVATENSLRPRDVKIPGTLVDGVVIASPENHWMSYITEYNPGFTSEIKTPVSLGAMAMDERKVIARRGLLEVVPDQVVNLGIGMAEGVALVAEEEKILSFFTLTTEPGVHGGVGASGHDFGPAKNYDAMLDMNQQFDFYNGGGLDVCFLGMAQVAPTGDVNVTRVGPALKGPGGFIDISQSTKRVNLMGTFTTGGLEVAVQDGKLVITKEGTIRKFVKTIPEIAFSGSNAVSRSQLVHYITERCVFALTPEGLELIEIAPGIDLQTQVLDLMDFAPIMRRPPRLMDARIFGPGRMRLLESLYSLDMAERLTYNADTRTLYIDLHGVSVTSPEAVTDIFAAIDAFFAKAPALAKKVDVFVNYDGFDCREELVDSFAARALAAETRH
jgi:propionate CoA-transferase